MASGLRGAAESIALRALGVEMYFFCKRRGVSDSGDLIPLYMWDFSGFFKQFSVNLSR